MYVVARRSPSGDDEAILWREEIASRRLATTSVILPLQFVKYIPYTLVCDLKVFRNYALLA